MTTRPREATKLLVVGAGPVGLFTALSAARRGLQVDLIDQNWRGYARGHATLLHAGLKLLRETEYWDGFVRLVDATDRQRGFGDYRGYALVAEGKAEIYVETDLKAWDLAPCKIIVEEAGGRFTDFAGVPTIHSGTAFATNGRLHAAALALLRSGASAGS